MQPDHSVQGAFVALAAAGDRLIRTIPAADAQADALRRRWAENQTAFFAARDAARGAA